MTDISDKDLESLRRMLTFETTAPENEWYLGWEWAQVSVATGTINGLIVKGLVKRTFSSRSGKNYKLTDAGKAVAEGGTARVDLPGFGTGEPDPVIDVSFDKIFSDIIGYDDIKELLTESLQLDKPIHVLLHGPPSLAKTMFLWDIERVGGEAAMWLIGSATSRAGLWDGVADKRPRWLLVDELDKMTVVDMAALLSLMEKGRLVRMKVGRKLDEKLKIWVIAAANRILKLPAELLSRFAVCHLTEYNAVEYRNVVTSALVTHEGTDENTAAEIATRLVGRTHDVRDAVRVARLAGRVGVQRSVELLLK